MTCSRDETLDARRRNVHFALEMCILLSKTTVGTALSNAKCTSRRQGAPAAVAVRPVALLPEAAAAQVVQILCKGHHRAVAPEESRGYSARVVAVDPGSERLCNRFGHDPAPRTPPQCARTSINPRERLPEPRSRRLPDDLVDQDEHSAVTGATTTTPYRTRSPY